MKFQIMNRRPLFPPTKPRCVKTALNYLKQKRQLHPFTFLSTQLITSASISQPWATVKGKAPLPRLTQKGLPWAQQNTSKPYQEPADGDWDDPHTSSQVLEAHEGNQRTWHEKPSQREEVWGQTPLRPANGWSRTLDL
jgi:hypothetical protein